MQYLSCELFADIVADIVADIDRTSRCAYPPARFFFVSSGTFMQKRCKRQGEFISQLERR